MLVQNYEIQRLLGYRIPSGEAVGRLVNHCGLVVSPRPGVAEVVRAQPLGYLLDRRQAARVVAAAGGIDPVVLVGFVEAVAAAQRPVYY